MSTSWHPPLCEPSLCCGQARELLPAVECRSSEGVSLCGWDTPSWQTELEILLGSHCVKDAQTHSLTHHSQGQTPWGRTSSRDQGTSVHRVNFMHGVHGKGSHAPCHPWSAGPCPHLEARWGGVCTQAPASCWQNLFPCSCQTGLFWVFCGQSPEAGLLQPHVGLRSPLPGGSPAPTATGLKNPG